MNGTADMADLLWEMSDVRQREAQLENLKRRLCGDLARVSNNLGVYFLFCLFGLAILALFLCRSSMQALQTSLFFFVLPRQVWQVLFINKFLQAGYSGFQVTGMIEWEQKPKPKKFPKYIVVRTTNCRFEANKIWTLDEYVACQDS